MRTLIDALFAWWRRDAIRISPDEGRLLAAGCPCIVRIDGQEAVLETRREVHADTPDHAVVFHGHFVLDDSECRLVVSVSGGTVNWQHHGRAELLSQSDIVVFRLGPRTP